MRFELRGLRSDTGVDVLLAIEAHSADEACWVARQNGIMPTLAHVMEEAAPADTAPELLRARIVELDGTRRHWVRAWEDATGGRSMPRSAQIDPRELSLFFQDEGPGLPPRGDPRRPVRRAVEAGNAIGILTVAVGLWPLLRAADGYSRGLAFIFLICLITGGLHLFLASHVANRRVWAVVCHLVLAGLQALLVGVVLALSLMFGLAHLAIITFVGAVLVALVLLIVYLSQSFRAIAELEGQAPRGFEVIVRPEEDGPGDG